MNKSIWIAGALVSALALAACKDDKNKNVSTPSQPSPVKTENSVVPETTVQKETVYAEPFLVSLTGIPVNRPNGNQFTADVVAYCGEIAEEYNQNSAGDVAEYKKACRSIIAGKLNYYACDRSSFLASNSTNNKVLRAHGLGMDESEIKDSYLFTKQGVINAGAYLGYNSYTLVDVSDVKAADKYPDFVPGNDCPRFLKR